MRRDLSNQGLNSAGILKWTASGGSKTEDLRRAIESRKRGKRKKKEKAAAGRFLGVASGLKLSPLMLPSSQS